MLRVLYASDPRIGKGALLLKINRNAIYDIFDYYFHNDNSKIRKLLFLKNGVKKSIYLKPGEELSCIFEEPKYQSCNNDCNYCFVKGLPKGLRPELYFRDDDYRLSFLFGNFISLTNLKDADISRIKRLKLSPLYVSVHTTDPALRARLFKNQKARQVLEQLKKLVEGNIQIHCQIVVIPGLTDGINLSKTVQDLSELYPGVNSVGIVPVGRTKFLRHLPMVNKKIARIIIYEMNRMQQDLRKRFNRGFVYLADEFFIQAGLAIPERSYYDDFPQYENGIGMVRELLDEIAALPNPGRLHGKFLLITGELAYPYIKRLKFRLNNKKLKLDVLPIKNKFFGDTITVSGLLVGQDIQEAINEVGRRYDRIILPPNCVNDKGKFLDDFELKSKQIIIAPYSIKELLLWLQ
ncbi:MAG: DUF512 domain-containing protein [candidate division WOR-3 bacterium]